MLRSLAIFSVTAAFALLFIPLPFFGASQKTLPTLPFEHFQVANQSGQADAVRCEARRCLIVYVSPWCPHCHAARPMIQKLKDDLANEAIPVKVIVGADSRESCADFASSFLDSAYLDPDEVFYDETPLQGVPAFMVVNQKGHILQILPGYIPDAEQMREALRL